MKDRRKEMAQQLLSRYYREGENFIMNIVTGDESWVACYDPQLKEQSKEYRHRTSPRHKKIRTEQACKKVMLTVFWDCEGVVHREFLPKGCMINSERYINTLRTLKIRLQRVRSHHPVFLLQHDNARPHTRARTIEVLSSLGFTVLPHPPYSPDLAPSDYYLFRHLKKHIKGIRYASDDKLRTAVSSWLRLQPVDFFETGIRKLISRWIRCIALNGDYVEV
ncbi:hypothetical protein PGB90_003895 [Kerria lacca]